MFVPVCSVKSRSNELVAWVAPGTGLCLKGKGYGKNNA
jgi:hypothetical protein